MNKCEIIGRLTRDPELRQNETTGVVRFSVAVNRRFSKEGQQTADFISCVAFGKTAEFVSKYFTKGMGIAVVGRIQTGNYTNSDGVKVYTTDVVAEEVYFTEKKIDASSSSKETLGTATEPNFIAEDNELPFN